ncbi:mismatch-specific DNA-glycosylase [Arthrobacter sp. MPF02]|uniref:mismatch-specific DNA-glycosylase n=1 Tax=Arthrobacter sp. MPF02 TaxID=3388492 RepID=UPI0039856A16
MRCIKNNAAIETLPAQKQWSFKGVAVLPDILAENLKAVIVGTAIGEASASRGHYYAGLGNDFWKLLHQSGLTPTLLWPEDNHTLPFYRIGLSDLNKTLSQSHDRGLHFDATGLLERMLGMQPDWVAFHGKTAAHAYARAFDYPRPGLGRQAWKVGLSDVFVLPQSSGANRRNDYDGRPSRLLWWREFAELIHCES